jgi:riboflavin biosynthesis pyrimidine reductase
MRSMHDAIMIGIGTAANDDPRLNGKYHMGTSVSSDAVTDTFPTVRLLPQAYQSETPQPIVLDPQLRLSPTARMLQALHDETTPHAKNPWLLCQKIQDWDQDIRKRKAALEQAGARIIEHDMPRGQSPKHILRSMSDC